MLGAKVGDYIVFISQCLRKKISNEFLPLSLTQMSRTYPLPDSSEEIKKMFEKTVLKMGLMWFIDKNQHFSKQVCIFQAITYQN